MSHCILKPSFIALLFQDRERVAECGSSMWPPMTDPLEFPPFINKGQTMLIITQAQVAVMSSTRFWEKLEVVSLALSEATHILCNS